MTSKLDTRKHQYSFFFLFLLISLSKYLCHGTKYWIVSTYARAILFIGRFCVAHLVKFRLKSTQKIVSVSFTGNISPIPRAGNFYQYLCSEFYLEDKHFGADMPLIFLILISICLFLNVYCYTDICTNKYCKFILKLLQHVSLLIHHLQTDYSCIS